MSPGGHELQAGALHVVKLRHSSPRRAADGHDAEPGLAALPSKLSGACAAACEQSGG